MLRCAASFVITAYNKYASFQSICAPCLRRFLRSRLIWQVFRLFTSSSNVIPEKTETKEEAGMTEKLDMEHMLDGKVAIITGGARGLGMAMSEGYMRAGAALTIIDRDAAGLDAAVKELSADGLKPFPIVLDIRFEDQIDRGVRTVLDKFGRIDVLVNNAAVLMNFVKGKKPERPKFWEIETEIWRGLWEINMMGTWLFSRRVSLEMMQARHGSIINITTSPHTMISERHIPYGPSKAGIDAFTKAAAKQLRPYGVRINALYPGDTEAREHGVPHTTRKGRPIMAPAAIYLGSDNSAEITGQSISAYRFNQEHGIPGV
jgi:NAD(P)-dependent dehydrogenase (short-subunit alcohol dehydrogenase family)